MKKSLIFTLFLLSIFTFSFAQNTILEARNMPIGTVVTVKGIAINGSELASPIRYFQDATAGIAAYGSAVDVVNRGDTISVTGTLKNYNQLLELDPITSVVVNSTGNTIPQPVVLTPNQISEPYEGMLVKVNNVVFNDAGLLFTGNKKYQFTSNGEIGYIYVKDEQNLVGTIIPTGEVSLTAICSKTVSLSSRPQSRFKPFKTAAASAEPPPNPAPSGTILCRWILQPKFVPENSFSRRAAFSQIFSEQPVMSRPDTVKIT